MEREKTPLGMIEDLKRFQKLRGITTKDLAAQAGISRTGLSQILNGHKSPTLATLEKICAVLNCRVIISD
jgi:transcriptional regulator with XRE-family HTH domain